MRKIIVSEFLTLDGVMQAPGSPDEDRSGGFKHGGWQLPNFDEIGAKAIIEGLNNLPKFVASKTMREPLAWNNSTLISGNVVNEIADLKRQPGNDLRVIGSGELVQMLMKHGLVDEYDLMIHPLVLGSGKHLFRDGGSKEILKLLDFKTSSKGVMILKYETEKK